VQRSFEWEQQFGEARAVLTEANKTAAQVTKANLEAAMRQAGYTQVRGINGAAWFEPGIASIQWITDSLPQDLLEELLARAAVRGVKLVLEDEQSWARVEQSWARAAKAALEKAALEKAALEEGEES
jgi:hypothetical protein